MINVTCALIVNEDKILVAQNNSNSDHPFQWEFPGGKVKENESTMDCIIREIYEELELKIEVLNALQNIEFDYGHKAICLIPFLCKIKSGVPKLNDHNAIKWLTLEEIQNLELSGADAFLIREERNRSILKEYFGEQMNNS